MIESRKLAAFKEFLNARGAQVLEPTNEWELVRFLAGGNTSVVYANKRGRVTMTGEAEEAWDSFSGGKAWRPKAGATPTPRKSMTPVVRTLLARDGDLCFFCAMPMGEDMTIEHLVALAHRGPNHVSNLFLAHAACNGRAGRLSAPEKIKLYVKARTA